MEVNGQAGTGQMQRTLDLHVAEVARTASAGIAALVVVRDISDIARTAAMKAELVANASHELRTLWRPSGRPWIH